MAKTPDYIAYSVAGGTGDKDRWRAVGAAFINKEDSITVMLDALPISGKIVLMPPKERDAEPPRGAADK